MKREKRKGTIKARSLINAAISNYNKTIESFLYVYPTDIDRRVKLINKTDEHGRTALFYACFHGNYDIMSLLLAAGAKA